MPRELTPLEQLQLMVPGYRGYKIKDLIRQDDFLIRQSVIHKLEHTISNLSMAESQIASQDPFSPFLKKIEYTISQIRTMISTVLSQQGGGADVYARWKIHTEQLDEIVQHDMGMINIANQILQLSNTPENVDLILKLLENLKQVIIQRQNLFFPPEYR